MRLPELQRILVEGAERQERPGLLGRLLTCIRARPLIALIPLLVLGAGTAGAVVAITSTKSRPLSGTITSARLGAPFHYAISVFPDLSVGRSGWQARVEYSYKRELQGFGEGDLATGIAGETLFAVVGGSDENHSASFGVVSDSVAAIRLRNGQTVKPISSPRLPHGTRAYVVFGPPPKHPGEGSGTVATVFLNAQGKPFPDHRVPRGFVVALPLRRLDPGRPGYAACAVHLKKRAGIVPIRQTISTPGPWPSPEPDALLSCSNAAYRVRGRSLVVAVLVNATDPYRRAPSLPGLTREGAHPGILAGRDMPRGELGRQPTSGEVPHKPAAVSARRDGVAWLVAQGGTASERAFLLRVVSTHV